MAPPATGTNGVGKKNSFFSTAAHDMNRGEGPEPVVGGMAKREHAGLAHCEGEGEREQRRDHHVDGRVQHIRRQEDRKH